MNLLFHEPFGVVASLELSPQQQNLRWMQTPAEQHKKNTNFTCKDYLDKAKLFRRGETTYTSCCSPSLPCGKSIVKLSQYLVQPEIDTDS
jgi:hypothetical protein